MSNINSKRSCIYAAYINHVNLVMYTISKVHLPWYLYYIGFCDEEVSFCWPRNVYSKRFAFINYIDLITYTPYQIILSELIKYNC